MTERRERRGQKRQTPPVADAVGRFCDGVRRVQPKERAIRRHRMGGEPRVMDAVGTVSNNYYDYKVASCGIRLFLLLRQ